MTDELIRPICREVMRALRPSLLCSRSSFLGANRIVVSSADQVVGRNACLSLQEDFPQEQFDGNSLGRVHAKEREGGKNNGKGERSDTEAQKRMTEQHSHIEIPGVSILRGSSMIVLTWKERNFFRCLSTDHQTAMKCIAAPGISSLRDRENFYANPSSPIRDLL